MSRSSRWETRNACRGANASACGTTSGITGTVRLPLERICGCEMGMRGMCAQLAARTMWWVGTRKTESVVGCLEDGLDWTARMCVGGVMPRLGAMSKEDGRRERGSCGGTTAAVIDAMSLAHKKKSGKKREKTQSVSRDSFREGMFGRTLLLVREGLSEYIRRAPGRGWVPRLVWLRVAPRRMLGG